MRHLIDTACPDFQWTSAHKDYLPDALKRIDDKTRPFVLTFISCNNQHSVTAFVDPGNKIVEVHDPLPSPFPRDIKKAIEKQFAGYRVIENITVLQKFNESCCLYLSTKKIIAYAKGRPFPSRQSILGDLKKDSRIIRDWKIAEREESFLQPGNSPKEQMSAAVHHFASRVQRQMSIDFSLQPGFRNQCLEHLKQEVRKVFDKEFGHLDPRAYFDAFQDKYCYFDLYGGHPNARYNALEQQLVSHYKPVFLAQLQQPELGNIAASFSLSSLAPVRLSDVTVEKNSLLPLLGDGSYGDKKKKSKRDPQRKKLTEFSIGNALQNLDAKTKLEYLEDAYAKVIAKPGEGQSCCYVKRSKCHAAFFLRLREDGVRMTGLQQKHIKLLKQAYIDVVKTASASSQSQLVVIAKDSALIKANRTNYQIAMKDEVASLKAIQALA